MARSEHTPDSIVIRGGHVVTMDPAIGDFESADILIEQGCIAAIAPRIETDAPEIDGRGHLVAPGFIDTHTHMWNSLWRTVDQPYVRVHDTLGAHFTPEDAHAGVALAAADMISSGVTTVHAWEHNCRTPAHVDAELTALREAGIRSHYSYGYHHDFAPEQITDFDDIERARDQWADDRTSVGFASRISNVSSFSFPRATPEVREREWIEARARGLRITHHVGAGSVPYEEFLPLAGPDVLFVHGYGWSQDAWKAFADLGTAASMSTYTSFGWKVPLPFTALKESGITVSLSYDHLAAPGAADTFRSMHAAMYQARFVGESITPRELFEYATIGGARALGLEATTGSLTPGKAADIMLIDTRRIGMSPFIDPYLALVNSARPEYVDTVIVGGRILKQHGALTGIDPVAVAERSTTSLHALFERAGLDAAGKPRA